MKMILEEIEKKILKAIETEHEIRLTRPTYQIEGVVIARNSTHVVIRDRNGVTYAPYKSETDAITFLSDKYVTQKREMDERFQDSRKEWMDGLKAHPVLTDEE